MVEHDVGQPSDRRGRDHGWHGYLAQHPAPLRVGAATLPHARGRPGPLRKPPQDPLGFHRPGRLGPQVRRAG
ncbi:hypothetical protein SSAG_01807 [Streptomyces sp. Mg1]|nr:hypothetical protein SSAG_01807 [Streptomyces sp. Mg1]